MAYFSNGTEGEVLDEQCGDCVFGAQPCPIALVQAQFNYKQIGNELARQIMNELISESGDCKMFEMIMGGCNSLEEKAKLNAWKKAVAIEEGKG